MSKKKLPPGIDPSKLRDGETYYIENKNGGRYLCTWIATLQKFWVLKYMLHEELRRIVQVRGPIIYDDIPWLMERINGGQEPTSQPNRKRRNPDGGRVRVDDLAGSAGPLVQDQWRDDQQERGETDCTQGRTEDSGTTQGN